MLCAELWEESAASLLFVHDMRITVAVQLHVTPFFHIPPAQYLHDYADEVGPAARAAERCDDPALLSTWARLPAYRWRDALPARAHDDPVVDFPEARARLAAKRELRG